MSDDPSSSSSVPRDGGASGTASLTKTILTWLRGLGGAHPEATTPRESLQQFLAEHADALQHIDREERVMLANILKLGELRVDDVMVPRADIVAVEESASVDEVIAVIRRELHSRLPVYRETLDDVIGMVHVKDILVQLADRKPFEIPGLLRETLFVPPSMSVRDLLVKMRASHIHLAIVVDEYGGTDGLVTIEDLVEEIVGEIEDEHDEAEAPMVVEQTDGWLEADGRAPIEDVEERLGFSLLDEETEDEVDTLGGLVFTLAGRVPHTGERVFHPGGFEFDVLDADPRRVKRLRVRRTAAPAVLDG